MSNQRIASRSAACTFGAAVAAMVMMASASPAQFPDIRQHEADGTLQLFGRSVAGVGDLDGDGRHEIAIGLPLANGAAGQVRVYSGADGGMLRLHSGAPGSFFGTRVRSIGDVDFDGMPDLAVGATFDEETVVNAGRVHVYSGATGALLYSVTGQFPNGQFGAAIDAVGDVDGDGVPDFVVGQLHADFASLGNEGAARVVSGATGATVRDHFGFDTAGFSGTAVAGVGDLTGDGVPDYAVGTPGGLVPGFPTARVRFYSGADGALFRTLVEQTPDEEFGAALASAGDLDGDSLAELIVGAPRSDLGGLDAGRVDVYRGSDGTLLFSVQGEPLDRLGFSVAGPGDLDQDGVSDFAAGGTQSPTGGGVVRAWSGLDASLILEQAGAGQLGLGWDMAPAGDVNGDGFPDLVVGEPPLAPSTVLLGRSHVLSSCGARTYGIASDPAAAFQTSWAPGATRRAGTVVTGATLGGMPLLMVVSIGFDEAPGPTYSILVDASPTTLVAAQVFTVPQFAPLSFTADLDVPLLAGISLFVQAFAPDFGGVLRSSNGLELRFCP